MNKLIITTLTILVCSSSLFSQSIITKSGLRFKVDNSIITTDRFILPAKQSNKQEYILYTEIDTIEGQINPSFKNDILKVNNSVVFIDLSDTTFKDLNGKITHDTYMVNGKKQKPFNQALSSTNFSTGDYLKSAGNRYITGIALVFGGSIITAVGVGKENEMVYLAGGVISLTGVIISITGHFQLIKAGNKMNSDAITISSASNGLGLAINF